MTDKWKTIKIVNKANVYVASALSLGVIPKTFRLFRDGDGKTCFEISMYEDTGMAEIFKNNAEEFKTRVTMLEMVMYRDRLFSEEDRQLIDLSKYAHWAIENELEPLAREFVALAGQVSKVIAPKIESKSELWRGRAKVLLESYASEQKGQITQQKLLECVVATLEKEGLKNERGAAITSEAIRKAFFADNKWADFIKQFKK
jgi:hypothetical protein